LTRHELKEQLQHDQFTDAVSGAFGYAKSHRQNVIRGLIALAVVLLLSGGGYWYFSHQRSLRQQDLGTALTVVDTPVGPANDYGKTFPTEDAKQTAARQALSGVVTKYPGSREGLIAQYYLGTLKAQANDTKGAEADLRTVADSTSEVAPLARIVNSSTGLVSKAQAQILLAQIDQSVNPAESKNILKSIDKSDQGRPAVSRAADQLSTQLAK
jgi:hypothetical protein